MEFLTEQYFRQMASRMPINEQRAFSDVRRGADPRTKKYDVFLSYNIADKEVIRGIYYALTKIQHLTVYLDSICDPDLNRDSTNKESAERIHNRLVHSRSLIYAQSSNAARSNWMPWELGVVDGNTNGKCMIMPVTSDAHPVTPRREYLLLYPYVELNNLGLIKVLTDRNPYSGQSIRDYISE